MFKREIDKLRDADTASDELEAPVQCQRITFGCCGQDWQGSKVDDVNMPSPTYGLPKFKNCVNPNKAGWCKQWLQATLLDGMQSTFDEIGGQAASNDVGGSLLGGR